MTKHLMAVLVASAAACGGGSPPSNQGPATPPRTSTTGAITDQASATAALEKRIGVKCLSFDVVDTQAAHFDIDVHEVHGGDCPGDPNTRPIFGRFRVARDGAITKENPATTEWEPVR